MSSSLCALFYFSNRLQSYEKKMHICKNCSSILSFLKDRPCEAHLIERLSPPKKNKDIKMGSIKLDKNIYNPLKGFELRSLRALLAKLLIVNSQIVLPSNHVLYRVKAFQRHKPKKQFVCKADIRKKPELYSGK